MFRLSVYYVLPALCIVEANDRIPLCTGMKQLNEDSISQAVPTADELSRISRARPVTRPRGRLSLHAAEGRRQKGPMGGTTTKGTWCAEPAWTSRLGRLAAPSCRLPSGPTASCGVLRGQGDRETWLLSAASSTASCRVAQVLRGRGGSPPPLLLTRRDTYLERVTLGRLQDSVRWNVEFLCLAWA